MIDLVYVGLSESSVCATSFLSATVVPATPALFLQSPTE